MNCLLPSNVRLAADSILSLTQTYIDCYRTHVDVDQKQVQNKSNISLDQYNYHWNNFWRL